MMDAGMTESFFETKQPAAVLKHELLRRYLRVYVQKTGSTSKDGRVAYLDAYAGPGFYDDGSAGSPAIAVERSRTTQSPTWRPSR
jgi:three-Cys-motif partner protein